MKTVLVINDTQKELDRNSVPAELVEKERLKRLSKVVEKYENYLEDKTPDAYDYQKLYDDMNEETTNVIISLNKEFSIERE